MEKDNLKRLTSLDAWTVLGKEGETIKVSDGPHGLRKVKEEKDGYQTSYPSMAYPTLSSLGNTFHPELVEQVASCIADDARKQGVDIVLGPGVNLKRTPLCGRNFEYFSEDPILSGTLGYHYIQGLQNMGVGASLKHFAVNNREYDRFFQSSEIDERTLNELYLKPFEIALKANPWTVMCSYNPVNGVLASENTYLLKETLRGRFKYEGTIISDWGAVRNRAKSLKAGIDIAFPFNPVFEEQLQYHLKQGDIEEKEVEEGLEHIDRLIEKATSSKEKTTRDITIEEKRDVCLKAAEESMVLLKNEALLPLQKEDRILLVGDFLNNPPIGGGGSSLVEPESKTKPLSACLKEDNPDIQLEESLGYMMRYGLPTPFGYKCSMEAAYHADKVIIGVGNTILEEKEETDRSRITLNPVFIDLVQKISKVNPNIILVLYCGSAIDLTDVEDKVKAILLAGYSGERVNEALSHILTGKACPSGHLAETWPMNLESTPTGKQIGDGFHDVYQERTLIGYRYYDALSLPVRYPFGYGLSYATFLYSDFKMKEKEGASRIVSFKVKNLSSQVASCVPQLYIRPLFSNVEKDYKELKKFDKIALLPNEEKTVTFVLEEEDFTYWSSVTHGYYLEDGVYSICIGENVRDIVFEEKTEIHVNRFSQFSRM